MEQNHFKFHSRKPLCLICSEKQLSEADCVMDLHITGLGFNPVGKVHFLQFRPPIALRTDLSHFTTEFWEIPVLRMAH